MRGRLFIVSLSATIAIAGVFMFVDNALFVENAFAFTATSTGFTVYQVITGVGAGATSAWSTSTNFAEVGDNEAITGTSTGGGFNLYSGLLWDIVGELNAASSSPSLTFTIDSNSETFPALTPGLLVATTSILSVNTTSSTGFNITVARNDSTGTLSKSGTYISDKSPNWSPGATCGTAGNATASSTSEQSLQFRVRTAGTDASDYCSAWWGTNDTSANALFAGIPSSATKIITRTSATAGNSVSYVLYNVDVPSTQKTGIYTGSITYTASVGP